MYIPISKANYNFDRAIIKDSILTEQFWFRKYYSKNYHGDLIYLEEYIKLTIGEFFNGDKDMIGFK